MRFFVSASLGARAEMYATLDGAVAADREFFPDELAERLRTEAQSANKLSFAV